MKWTFQWLFCWLFDIISTSLVSNSSEDVLCASNSLNGLWLFDDYVSPEGQKPPGQIIFHVNSFHIKQVTLVSSTQLVRRVLGSQNQRDCSKVSILKTTLLLMFYQLYLCLVCFFNYRMDLVKHTGGCHCGAVRFEVWSLPDLHVFHCKYALFHSEKKIQGNHIFMNMLTNADQKYARPCLYWSFTEKITHFLSFSVVAFAQRNKTIISLFQKINSNSYRWDS